MRNQFHPQRNRTICLALILCWLFAAPAIAESEKTTKECRQAIVDLLIKYRTAAANADATKYFECLDKDAIFLGTDGTERFSYEQLHEFLDPYFAKGIGWNHDVKKRQVFVGPNQQIGWFEEHSERPALGPMRTTGVVWKTDAGWKIIQYNVSLVIPNEIINDVASMIRQRMANTDGNPATPSPSLDSMTNDQWRQAEESFEYVWQKIRDSYWDPELGGVDWQSAHDELKAKLNEAKTEADAFHVMSELVARMKVSHFAIIPKSAYQELGQSDEPGARRGVTGIDVRIVGDAAIVVGVAPESAAAAANIRPGWIVESVDGKAAAKQLAELRTEFADNPHARVVLASAANSRLRGNVGDKINVTFLDGEDQRIEHTLELAPDRGQAVQFGHIPEFRVWVEVKSLEGNIGYFRFNAFMNPVQVMTAFNKFISDNRDSAGIIIDVRGNGGGSGGIAMGMIGWLMTGEKASFGKVILRDSVLDMVVRPRPNPFRGPVAVLIDEMSVSAAEFFASGIKDLTDARIIGTRTAGAVLGSQIERLPTGDGFQFAAANFISHRTGKTLEGLGVSPHEVVEPDREMLLHGKDSAIEAANAWISSQHN